MRTVAYPSYGKGIGDFMKKLMFIILSVIMFGVVGCDDVKVDSPVLQKNVKVDKTSDKERNREKITEKAANEEKTEVATKKADLKPEETTAPVAEESKPKTEPIVESEETKKEAMEPEQEIVSQTEPKKDDNIRECSKTMYVQTGANVRKGPGTGYEILGQLAKNDVAEITGQAENGWYRITFHGGEGFISNSLLGENPVNEKKEPIKENPTNDNDTVKHTEETVKSETKPERQEDSTKSETEQKPSAVSYRPENIVRLAIAKCQAGGMITTEDELKGLLANGTITREQYEEYYPLDGLEESYYSVFVNVDLNKAATTSGRLLQSEQGIADYIADMLLLESNPVFNLKYVGTYKTSGETFYEFRCYR